MVYADHCLLYSNQKIMADANRIFNYLEQPKGGEHFLKACKTIIPSPFMLRKQLHKLINAEIKNAKQKKPAAIILKMNSLSDEDLIDRLYDAAKAGVEIKLIVRGIFCMLSENKKFKKAVLLSALWMNTWNMQECGYFIIMAKRKFIYLRQTGCCATLIIV